jgi:hypothetical protein
MSIFKATFKEGVCNQLKVRQKAINNRTPGNLTYYNSRNAWIRMTSAIEVNGDKGALANKYILQGGILDPNKNLRSGIGVNGAYNNASPDGKDYRLGIRPMPGITSLEVKSKAAYGSLREATINFVCWDIRQLEDLELLYMRPGYSAMVEWGWSPYLKNIPEGELETNVSFVNDVLEAQNGKPSKDEIYKKTFNKASSTTDGGNYDAEYGRIQNYSWKARMDGGYDCTTTLISWGEIMESLKINYGSYKTDVGKNSNFKDPNITVPFDKDSNISKSYAKNKLAGVLNELYLIARGGFGGSYSSGASGGLVNTITNVLDEAGNAIVNTAEAAFNAVTSIVTGTETSAFSADVKSQAITLDGESYEFALFEIDIANNAEQLKDSDFEGSKQIYITLEGFVKILNKYILLQDTANKNAVVEVSTTEGDHMEHPGNPLLCLGDKLQLSTNPSVCLIKNTAWNNPADLGFDEGFSDDFSTLKKVMETLTKNYWYKDTYVDTQFGIIQNIYVNLAYLYSLIVNEDLAAQDKKEKNDISMFDFLKNMMNGISTSIGNVATFDIFIDPQDSKARIIDVNYVDANTRNDAFEKACVIQLHNLNSTARSYSFESQIFPEQSSMIAIGAQVKGGALGDKVDTLVDYNQNLIDRVVPAKDAPLPQNQVSDPAKEKEDALTNLKENVDILVKYINQIDADWYEVIGDFDVSESGKYSNALKDIISYFKNLFKDDNKNRAIIPTKLSIELDGLGGIVIGNLFRIPEELMPRGYKGDGAGPAKLGYTVTGLGHTISGNDWKTKIDAQFIILDEPKGTATTADLAAVKTIINAADEVKKNPKKAIEEVETAVKKTKKIIENNKNQGGGTGTGCKALTPDVSSIPDSALEIVKGPFTTNTTPVDSLAVINGKPVAVELAKAFKLMAAACKKETNETLSLNSGFRSPYTAINKKSTKGNTVTAQSQDELYKLYIKPVKGTHQDLTAPPGTSPHGYSVATDLNTGGNHGKHKLGNTVNKKLYQWLITNAYKFGFVRYVAKEEWHWQYMPGTYQYNDRVPRTNKYYYDLNLDSPCDKGGTGASTTSTTDERQNVINKIYCGLVNNIVQSGYYKGKTWEVFKAEQKVTPVEESIAKQSCNKTGKVDAIFIGGLETLYNGGVLMTQAEQLKLFKKTYGDSKNVKGFKHNADTSLILNVLKENPKIPVVMFSKGCDIANIIAADSNADKNKIYIVEPWAKKGNAAVSDAVKKGVPANHVYVGTTPETGKGVVVGVSLSKGSNHFDALTKVAPLVK